MVFFLLGTALYAFYKTQPALLDPAMERNDDSALFHHATTSSGSGWSYHCGCVCGL